MTVMEAVSISPKHQWNLLVDEIKRGFHQQQAITTVNHTNTENHVSVSLAAPYLSGTECPPPPAAYAQLEATRNETWPYTPPGRNHVSTNCLQRRGYCLEASPAFYPNCPPTETQNCVRETSFNALVHSTPPEATNHRRTACLRKVELPKRRQQPLQDFEGDWRGSAGLRCAQARQQFDSRRYYVRQTLAASPHTVSRLYASAPAEELELADGAGGREKRRRKRRSRRKTRLHGRSAAYRVARRNAIKSKRRKTEIVSSRRSYYKARATFSPDIVTDSLFLSLLAVLCFFPLGIASMCYTFAVRRHLSENDNEKAYLSSLKARKLADTGVMFGITALATALVIHIVKANMPYAWVEYDYYLPDYN